MWALWKGSKQDKGTQSTKFSVERGNTGNTYTRFKHFFQTIKNIRYVWRYSPKLFYCKIYELIRKTIHLKKFWNIWYWKMWLHDILLKLTCTKTQLNNKNKLISISSNIENLRVFIFVEQESKQWPSQKFKFAIFSLWKLNRNKSISKWKDSSMTIKL